MRVDGLTMFDPAFKARFELVNLDRCEAKTRPTKGAVNDDPGNGDMFFSAGCPHFPYGDCPFPGEHLPTGDGEEILQPVI